LLGGGNIVLLSKYVTTKTLKILPLPNMWVAYSTDKIFDREPIAD
jgi:hypothetical protein